jgi:N-alpha-acetyltransferase 60
MIGSFVNASALSVASRKLLISNEPQHPRLFYIMTVGTTLEYRHVGLATQLIQNCIKNVIEPDQQCGTLYLHVLPSNIPAIRFYEKLQFHRVHEIVDYYTIDGKLHNAYLYAKYFHGTLLLLSCVCVCLFNP